MQENKPPKGSLEVLKLMLHHAWLNTNATTVLRHKTKMHYLTTRTNLQFSLHMLFQIFTVQCKNFKGGGEGIFAT